MAEFVTRLKDLASAIRDAADKENWEDVNSLMLRLDEHVKTARFTSQDKSNISESVKLLDEAISSATRRKEEIRNLVNQIGNSPL